MRRIDKPSLPWRQRAAERAAAQSALALAADSEIAVAKVAAIEEAKRIKEEGFWAQYFKPLAIPIVLAILAFYTGQVSERVKLHDQDERLAVENRRRLFVNTAQDFGIYLTHWSRLRVVTPAQDAVLKMIEDKEAMIRALHGGRRPVAAKDPTADMRSLSAEVKLLKEELKLVGERKERYVKSRDDAKDRLYGNFEQARLFFGRNTTAAIITYENFEQKHGAKLVPELPPIEDWRKLATDVFENMRIEIRNDEKRLQSAGGSGVATR